MLQFVKYLHLALEAEESVAPRTRRERRRKQLHGHAPLEQPVVRLVDSSSRRGRDEFEYLVASEQHFCVTLGFVVAGRPPLELEQNAGQLFTGSGQACCPQD